MVLTTYFVLSPVIGLVCHRRLADMARSPGRAREIFGFFDFRLSQQYPPETVIPG
jgi:hypothetical protein